ncbi:hypothetical protein DNTS_020597 [Danionella cerebrum]|uniref:MARVEL domain-containing protein n=1 Tax=Danionella cerebrum TaxID=2873325 RepID=A0A553R565_9TELE|nr:hypothetical protein DNTS_020597 [Danionella translucida]
MLQLDLRKFTEPVGIVRMFLVLLTCICFALVASAGIPNNAASYWAWCMFCWTFCCLFTLLIFILELTSLKTKVPISWDDFTMAFAMLSTLMMVTVSIIYPSFFTCSSCSREIGASVVSWLAFGLYVGEVWLLHRKPGEISGFLSTVPGLLKILETFIACMIFTSLSPEAYKRFPGTQWCVFVYSICFICSLLIILLTISRVMPACMISFEKVVIGFNGVAVALYATAVVIWPLYMFKDNPRPVECEHCPWDNLVVITFMTVINLLVYTTDVAYSVKLVFFSQQGQG